MSNEKLDIEGVKTKVRRAAGEVPRLPHADRRRDRQHSRRRQGRARRPRASGSRSTARSRACSRTPTRSPASPARTCARCATGCPRRASCSPSSATSPLPLKPRRAATASPIPTVQRAQYERFGFKTWLRELESATPAPRRRPRSKLPSQGRRSAATARSSAKTSCKDVSLQDRAPCELVGFDTDRRRRGADERAPGRPVLRLRRRGGLPAARARLPGRPGSRSRVDRRSALLKPWLERADCRKVGENVKFDAHVLANHGVRLAGCVHDTLLESYVLEVHERHDLGMLAQRHCGWTMLGYDEVTGKGAARIPFASVEIARATEYAAARTDCALALHELLFAKIEDDEKLDFVYGSIEMPALPVLLRMERNGVLLDRAKLDAQSHELGKEILGAGTEGLRGRGPAVQPRLAEADPGDPVRAPEAAGEEEDALGPAVDRRGLARRARARPSAAEADPRAPRALQAQVDLHRQAAAGASTRRPGACTRPTRRPPRSPAGSRPTSPTCRTSRSAPPAGRRIRECFIAPPGSKIVSADYSQIELRIMAHLSGDENLRRAFRDGEDVHRATAAEVFGVPLDEVEQRSSGASPRSSTSA